MERVHGALQSVGIVKVTSDVVQALAGVLLPTAMMYVLERRVRGAFLHSIFAREGKAAAKEGYEPYFLRSHIAPSGPATSGSRDTPYADALTAVDKGKAKVL